MMETPEYNIVWQAQPGPQLDLVRCPLFEVFYGGARGGGKTEASIGDWFSHAGKYGELATGLFIRRKLTQLSDVIKRFKRYGGKLGCKWREQAKELIMPNGAILKFAYLESDDDAEEYQGHEYTRIYIEEVTNFPFPEPIMKLKATLRTGKRLPNGEAVQTGMRLTGNPGGPGHHWVKARYIDPAPAGYKVIREEEEIQLADGTLQTLALERVFIPAKLKDNKKLMEADPTYILKLKQTGSETLVKAWLEGDWNGVDGTFFSEFSEDRHVLRGKLALPAYWTRFRALDWGSAAPFSVGWYAVSDGSVPRFPSGALIKFAEWYGWNGKPNKGLKMSASSVAQGIIVREKAFDRISYGVADPSIFANNGGPSIAEMMIVEGAAFMRGDNARQAGWEQMRKRLALETPLLYFHEDCEQTIRTLPYLQHDDKNPEDLDTDGEDHAADETRYAVMSRPSIRTAPKPSNPLDFSKARPMPTINEIIAKNRALRLSRENRL